MASRWFLERERADIMPMTAAEYALSQIMPGQVIGLGTGRAATAFIRALGARVADGLKMSGVPTSVASEALARELGIPLTTLESHPELDLAVDGADEVDPELNLIKGLGGALLREKVVAAAARRVLILVGPEKLVERLGTRSVLPVEVLPFAAGSVVRRLAALGLPGSFRQKDGRTFVSDNGNWILDCQLESALPLPELERQLSAMPGLIDTGLFLGMADQVAVDDPAGVRLLTRTS